MAGTLTEALKVSKHVRKHSSEIDYTRYENTRKIGISTNGKREISTNQIKPNQRQENSPLPHHHVTRSSSSRKYEDPDKKVTAQFRTSRSETKEKPFSVDHHNNRINRPESRNKDRTESQNKDRTESRNKDRPESRTKDRPESRNKDRPESRNKDRPDSRNKDRPESRNKDRPESRNKDRPHSRNRDHSESRNRDHRESRNRDRPESGNRDRPQSRNGECLESRNRNQAECKTRNLPENKKGEQTKSRNKDLPLQEVKRKLQFDDDEDEKDKKEELPPRGLDFTDKIAALRTLIGRDREARTISDRRAYYESSHKRIMVSRNDSLKENHHEYSDDKDKRHERKVNSESQSERMREVKSADIFKTRMLQDGRLSAVDIQLLRGNLEERRKKNNVLDLNSPIKEEKDLNKDKNIDSLNKFVTSSDAILHATKDRKVIISRAKKQNLETTRDYELRTRQRQSLGLDQVKEKRDYDVQNSSRPSSRLESREIQTDVLNHSIRSVQSNAPFFESSGRISVPVTELEKRIHVRPTVGREVSKDKKRILCKVQNREGIERGIKLAKIEANSPGRSIQTEARQTNVQSFVGNSLTPEKEKLKESHLHTDEIDIERLKEKVSKLSSDHYMEDDDEVKKHLDRNRKSLQTAQANQRPNSRSRTSITGHPNNYAKSAKQNIYKSKYGDILHRNNSIDNDAADELFDKDFPKRICLKTDRTDRKVREWIENQSKVAETCQVNAGPMLIDELSVSVSITTETRDKNLKVLLNSPSSGSCDKIPVKLARTEKPKTTGSVPQPLDFNNLMQLDAVHHVANPRQTISDRLERVSVAVASEKNRLESEIPVRDGMTGVKKDVMVLRQKADSESLETESSIFSLPFSIESGESMSSTVQAVKLLRKLYNVDTETRQNLVLMAKCFRRWLNNVIHAKRLNLRITQAASRVSPISYGVMLRKGDICYRTSVLSRCFTTWRIALRGVHLHRAVSTLRRKHMLQKGMNAFKWAINRSKLQQGILQDRVNGMLLVSYFDKWKCRAVENRRLRLQQAFLRWRQFTKEAQKIRMLRNQTNMKLKQKIFQEWCEKFQMRLKQNKADFHFRMVLKSHGWLAWKQYTLVTKEKKHRETLAVQMFEGHLQQKMFTCIKAEFVKYSKAKHFHRVAQLKLTMKAWKVGTQICKKERENDSMVAMVYWSRTTVRTHFTAWRDSLLTRRACRMSDKIITKHAFTLWNSRYSHLIQRRQAVDSYIRHKVLTTAFKHWCTFVMIMKRRRAAAVECIHSALQRHVLQKWRCYTKYKRNLRKQLQIHVRKCELEKQRKCMSLWRSHFKVKCDIQKAQQFWSNTCAKKAADIWRLVCHKRRLVRLLNDTEPLRQLSTQGVFFKKWRSRLQLIENEKHEAADVRMILDLSQLQTYFGKWKFMTQQLLLIKPMVLRYRQRLVSQCFTGWRKYVHHKAECAHSETMFAQVQLRHRFATWRRQYLAHQIEKEFNKKLVQRRARRCIQAWHFVIKRKHSARLFHERQVVRTAFYYWNTLAVRQLRQKKQQQVELETVMATLQEYFDRWRERLYKQQSQAEEGVDHLQQQQDNNRVKVMFYFWRRHFRATLVARENEKIRIRRLARLAIQEWHKVTQNSLNDAVGKFAAAIGLHQGAGDTSLEQADVNGEERNFQGGDTDFTSLERLELMFEPMNHDPYLLTHSCSSPRTPHTPHTPHTPRHGSAFGTPMKRLFSPPLSRQSLAQSLDFDAGTVLTSTSFLDARFEMEHAVKVESRREIVVTAVTRLRHWPVSIMFELWKEYTVRQREFKHLTTKMITSHQGLALAQYFKTWVRYHKEMQLAKQHYEQVLQHKALLSFLLYRNSRKEKKQLKLVANLHFARKVYTRVFPMWLAKAQEKHHKEHIVHLWTNITAEERELIPRERSFRYQLNKKTLRTCYSVWFLSYQRKTKLKRAYHRILMERYFGAWCNWALEKHERRVKCDQFREQRIKKLVFKMWCLRYTQKTEVARRYDDAWHNYLGAIVQAWSRWAKDQRKRTKLALHVSETRQCHLVTKMFTVWKSSAEQQIRIQKWYESRLMVKTVYAWQGVATLQRNLHEKQLKCQLVSYTILAKRAFRQWHSCYLQKLDQHKQHEQRVQTRVLRMANKWRRKAQTSRGKVLEKQFQTQQMQRMFYKWRAAYNRNLDRVGTLEDYLAKKNLVLVSHYLDTWRTELMALQAERVFNMKLLTTLLANWRIAAKACKHRRETLVRYRSGRQHYTQKVHFLYWYNVAKARKSIRGHANLKIQLSVFKAWLVHTRKKKNLRRLETAFTRKRNHRILQNNWYLIKTRFDYCVELADMASRVIHEKNLALMKQALSHWEFRLKIVIADECHEHILAKRVATRWCRFVQNRRWERQRMAELMLKAKKFYHRKLCNKIYVGWHNEVLVTRQVQKHKARLCVKYANLWKYKVDMTFTAKCVRNENLYLTAWKIWHMEFVKRRTIQKVEAFQRKQTLTMIFVSWRNLCKKRSRRISMIPLPVSPAFSMPSAGTSSSSTPTDELSSPEPFLRPSQIPLPNLSSTRGKSRLPSSNGSTTPTGPNGRNTPTGSIGRNTPTGFNRKQSFGY